MSKADRILIEFDRLREMSKAVQLANVVLMQLDYASSAPPDVLATGLEPRYKFNLTAGSWHFVQAEALLHVFLAFELRAEGAVRSDGAGPEKERSKESTDLFRFSMLWNVRYQVPKEFVLPSEDAVADFAYANGQLSAYPYVRQLVQDITGKAGWPPLVMGVFRVPSHRPADKMVKVPPPASA